MVIYIIKETIGKYKKEKKEINNIVNKKIEEKKINLKEKYLSKKTEEEIVTITKSFDSYQNISH